MNRLIEEKRQELEGICRDRKVRRIELFGSAAGSAFDPERSDLDFLVSFQDLGSGEYADAYFGLLEDLQALFQRPVDLVVDAAFQNPYFRQTVETTRTLVYAS
jgi:predicted nucleotidyltransferase